MVHARHPRLRHGRQLRLDRARRILVHEPGGPGPGEREQAQEKKRGGHVLCRHHLPERLHAALGVFAQRPLHQLIRLQADLRLRLGGEHGQLVDARPVPEQILAGQELSDLQQAVPRRPQRDGHVRPGDIGMEIREHPHHQHRPDLERHPQPVARHGHAHHKHRLGLGLARVAVRTPCLRLQGPL